MRFGADLGVPKKSGVARLFKVFATDMLANFQDRLVVTASISLRIGFSYLLNYNSTNYLPCQHFFEKIKDFDDKRR